MLTVVESMFVWILVLYERCRTGKKQCPPAPSPRWRVEFRYRCTLHPLCTIELALQNAQVLQKLCEHVPSASLAAALDQADTMRVAHESTLAQLMAAEQLSMEQLASSREETAALKAQLASSNNRNSQLQLDTQELMAENTALTQMMAQVRAEADQLR